MDVGSNDDAIVLMKDGKQITLGKDGDCPLPLINNQKTTEEMELKLLALQLGLPETATEADVNRALNELKAAKAENDSLKQENEKLTLARITGLVEKAVAVSYTHLLFTSSGRVTFFAALASFHPSAVHHFDMVTRDTSTFSAISVCSIPERNSERARDFFFSISAFVI